MHCLGKLWLTLPGLKSLFYLEWLGHDAEAPLYRFRADADFALMQASR